MLVIVIVIILVILAVVGSLTSLYNSLARLNTRASEARIRLVEQLDRRSQLAKETSQADFQELLKEIDSKLSTLQHLYNSAAGQFNVRRRALPASIFASWLGFGEDRELFELSEIEIDGSQSTETGA